MASLFLLVVAAAVLLCGSAHAQPVSAQLGFQFFSLQLVEVGSPATDNGLGPLAPSSFGSVVTFRSPIQNYNTGETIGHDQGSCTYTIPLDLIVGAFEVECEFTIVLRQGNNQGSFTLTGQFLDTPSDLAVVGGTGLFTDASGVCRQSTLESTADFTEAFGYNCEFFARTPLTPTELSPKAPGPIASGPAP